MSQYLKALRLSLSQSGDWRAQGERAIIGVMAPIELMPENPEFRPVKYGF